MPADRNGREAARLVAVWGGVVMAASVVVSLVGWWAAEPGQQAVLHRGLDGEPTRVGSLTEPLVVMPLIALGMWLLMLAAARWGHHLRYSDQPLPAPRPLAAVLVGCCALVPALQVIMLVDAFDLLGWDQTQLLVQVVVALPLLLLGVALRHPATAGRMAGMVNLPMPRDSVRRARVVAGTGNYLLVLGGLGLLAAFVAPFWVFIGVVGPGATFGAIALLAFTLKLQNEELRERRAGR